MDKRLQVALDVARQAGKIIKAGFGKDNEVELKSDHSPVTKIDRQINALVVDVIRNNFPGDGLLGEEENYGTGHERYKWVCDPLDGTKPFILGLPNSVFMLALSEGGVILLSVVYDPHADRMYHAVMGDGAFCNGERLRVNDDELADGYALVGADSLRYGEELKKLSRGVEPVPGTGFKFLMIASGRGVGMINDSADFHDIGPGSLIVEEAGGKVTDLQGGPLRYDDEIGGVVVSNGTAHDALLAVAQNH